MKRGLFLDLDETIISVSSEKEFLKYLNKKDMVSHREMLEIVRLFVMHKLYLIKDYKKAKRETTRLLLKGKNYDEIINIYNAFFKMNMIGKIYPDIYELIRLHKGKNDEIYIISASLDFIVEEFCRHLGVTGYFAVQTEKSDGVFTGEITGPVMFSEEKANIIKMLSATRNIDLEHSYAFSDSFLDIPMLSVVGKPTAVNPDKKLLQEAKRKNWIILNWGEAK